MQVFGERGHKIVGLNVKIRPFSVQFLTPMDEFSSILDFLELCSEISLWISLSFFRPKSASLREIFLLWIYRAKQKLKILKKGQKRHITTLFSLSFFLNFL